MIWTEDRGRTTADKKRKTEDGTALENLVRPRVSDSLLCHLDFSFLTNLTNQTNETKQLMHCCHLDFGL
jgi:hypothetical protein